MHRPQRNLLVGRWRSSWYSLEFSLIFIHHITNTENMQIIYAKDANLGGTTGTDSFETCVTKSWKCQAKYWRLITRISGTSQELVSSTRCTDTLPNDWPAGWCRHGKRQRLLENWWDTSGRHREIFFSFLLHRTKEAFRVSPTQWKVTMLIQGYRETWSSEWKPEEVVFHSKGKAERLLCFNITMMEKTGKKCHLIQKTVLALEQMGINRACIQSGWSLEDGSQTTETENHFPSKGNKGKMICGMIPSSNICILCTWR